MSKMCLIIGESGTGKSTSLRNLDPSETYLINVLDKALPFRGYKKNYRMTTRPTETEPAVQGNLFITDKPSKIIEVIKNVSTNLPHIKNLIIDDFQYIIASQYMNRAMEKGYERFSEIGQQTWLILKALSDARPDLNTYVLSHSTTDDKGRYKPKTIGKMLDSMIVIEGMFTIVLHSLIVDERYMFMTQNDGIHMAKSPMGMFEDKLIDNDLKHISDVIRDYSDDEI